MKPIFRSHLGFRQKGDFGQCDVCYKLRSKIRKAETKALKNAATKAYTRHLLSQWLDRAFYWSQRALSRQWFTQAWQWGRKLEQSILGNSVLCIIQDGMDQSKLRVPRCGYNAVSKGMTKLYRPALHLIGTFAHGHKLRLSVTDEDLKKNSETSVECLALALSQVIESHGKLPLTFHLQQDNCFREGKNKYMVGWCLMLVILGAVRFSSLGFLRTSHSHEDIDQAFGQVARLLMGKVISSADELVAILNDAVTSESRIRGSSAEASKLDEVANWKDFTQQLGLSFKGLRRVHYFRFLRRKDLGSDVLDNVLELEEYGRRWVPHEDDIFLTTKRWLADKQVVRALVVVPASLAAEIRKGYQDPQGVTIRKTIVHKMRQNLEKLVPSLRSTGELTRQGSDYLLNWCKGKLYRYPRPQSYPILSYRFTADFDQPHVPGQWARPNRVKHFDLALEAEDLGHEQSSDSSGTDDACLDLPEGFG